MARPTLFSHPKFAKLTARLNSRALALGSLELIWETAYAAGDPVIGDADVIESIADWRGPQGELAYQLVDCGFLEVMQTDANGGRLLKVHDLEDHAPEYVIKRWKREEARRQQGKTIRQVRQDAAAKRWSKTTRDAMQTDANGATPAPAPAPITDRSTAGMQTDANGGRLLRTPFWSAGQWRARFGPVWAKAKNRLAYGMASDGVACGKLGDLLERMQEEAPGELLQAQAQADAIFAAFLGDTYEPLVKAQHPFAWFVQRFGALVVDVATAAASVPKPLRLAPVTDPILAPVGTASAARAAAASRRTQPHAASAAAAARPRSDGPRPTGLRRELMRSSIPQETPPDATGPP